jgi:hypothetical protein
MNPTLFNIDLSSSTAIMGPHITLAFLETKDKAYFLLQTKVISNPKPAQNYK